MGVDCYSSADALHERLPTYHNKNSDTTQNVSLKRSKVATRPSCTSSKKEKKIAGPTLQSTKRVDESNNPKKFSKYTIYRNNMKSDHIDEVEEDAQGNKSTCKKIKSLKLNPPFEGTAETLRVRFFLFPISRILVRD